MEFHGTPWKASSLETTPWNSMEIHVLILHGIPWKIFQRIPWNSMEFHGNPCPNAPWNSMENIPSNSMELHGIPWRYFTREALLVKVHPFHPIRLYCVLTTASYFSEPVSSIQCSRLLIKAEGQ